MPRYRLLLEYDGTPFAGWQRQANARSVQQALEEAIVRFAGHEVRVQGAGRTDAGVHAAGQVAHVDLAREWRGQVIRDAGNAHLRPEPIVILSAERAADGFNARTDAVRRHYLYRILSRRPPPALEANRVWHVPYPLDATAMAEGARHLLGRHDFTTFRASQCQAKSPVRTLDQLDVERDGPEVLVRASARSFLHHQVRSIVGSLALVGAGRWSAEDLRRALEARERAACGPIAPASGLTLMQVDYAEAAK